MDFKKLNYLNQHKKPTTRREFISLGLVIVGGVLFAPRIGKSLSLSNTLSALQEPRAQQIPFLVYDLAGGAALPANFLVGAAGGPQDLLPSYDQLGWNPRTGGFDDRFGLPLAKPEVSGIMRGLLEVLSPEVK